MASTRKSLALSFAQKYTNLIVQLASVMLIARLLTPNEIGVFAVAAAVLGLAHAVRDFGVNNYLVQEPNLTSIRVRTAFTVSLLMSWLMALLIFCAKGAVARFYGEPGLDQVMSVLSLSLLFMPFSMPVISLLQREMRFGALYWINSGGGLVTPAVTVALALMDYGFMSLAWGSVAGALVTTAIALAIRREHLPTRPSLAEWRRVLSFGSQSTAIGLLTELSMRSKSLIMGALLGFGATAIFERAQKILSIYRLGVAEGIGPLVLPVFSATHRSGADARSSYLSAMGYLTALNWPFFSFLFLMAHPVVLLLFGDQWTAAAPIVQVLCLYGMISPVFHLNPQILIAVGGIGKNLLVQAVCLPIFLVAVTWASTRSLMDVAIVSVAVSLLKGALFHHHLGKALGFGLRDLGRAVRASALIAIGSTAAPLAAVILFGLEPGRPLLALSLATASSLGLWFVFLSITGHPLKAEYARARQFAARHFRAPKERSPLGRSV